MYEIIFYKDRHGNQPVKEYIDSLIARGDKDSRIKARNILDYIKILEATGTRAGEKYVKHIEDKIWELRPLRDRIFFVTWHNGKFILLHHFMKTTQKTPRREIDQAKREYEDIIERADEYE